MKKCKVIKMSDFLKTGIYFLFKGNKLVYIGTTSRYPIRFAAHLLVKDFDSFRFVEYPYERCYNIERRLINYFRPKYNICQRRKINGKLLVFRES